MGNNNNLFEVVVTVYRPWLQIRLDYSNFFLLFPLNSLLLITYFFPSRFWCLRAALPASFTRSLRSAYLRHPHPWPRSSSTHYPPYNLSTSTSISSMRDWSLAPRDQTCRADKRSHCGLPAQSPRLPHVSALPALASFRGIRSRAQDTGVRGGEGAAKLLHRAV